MSSTEAPGRSLFEWLPFLTEALTPFPETKLVLSSSWCIRPGYGSTLKRFPESLRSKFIGGTYHKRIHGMDTYARESFYAIPRGQQVLADVQRRKPAQWLALDDSSDGWTDAARENLVLCDGATGLSSPAVRTELHEKLERCHQALLHSAANPDT